MKTNVRIQSYRNDVLTMHFVGLGSKYFIRVAKTQVGLEWELRFYKDDVEWTITHIDDTIGLLKDMGEDELFQQSCVHEYDVYLVKSGMNTLHDIIIGGESVYSSSIELEY